MKQTFVVQRGDVVQQVVFPGRVQPVTTQQLAFLASGTVRTVYAQVGDTVTAGEMLADLDTIDALEAELAAVRSETEAAAGEVAAKMRRAEIALEIAQLRLKLAQSQRLSPDEIRLRELEVELAQMDLNDLSSAAGPDSPDARIRGLEASIAAAQLRASMNGQLMATVSPGDEVRSGAPVAVVGDPTALEVIALTSSDQLAPLSEGMTVTLTLRATGQTVAGRLRQLPYPYGSGGPTGGDASAHISLESSRTERAFHLGDDVQVTVVLAHKTGVLWLPLDAIRSVGGRVFVILQTPDGRRHVNVVTGASAPDRVEIVEGLSEGQVVVAP